MKLSYEALVFDLGGVIVAHDNALMYDRIAEGCTAPDALAELRTVIREPHWQTGTKSIAALHQRLRAELGYRRDWDAFVDDWCCHFAIDQTMLDFVTQLAGEHRVFIFSNTNHEHWQHLIARTDGALGCFEAYVSHEIGMAKPDPEAYLLVARRAGIAPERSLFIDDKADNVDGARRAGFQSEIFTDQATLERYLRAAS